MLWWGLSRWPSVAGWAPLALRIPIGIIFVAHGAQKLFGAFGGYGLEGTGQFMDSLGLSPGYLMALLAGAAEFFGGLALLLLAGLILLQRSLQKRRQLAWLKQLAD